MRTKLKQQYEKEFRDPAVLYLKKAEGSVESPAYVEGLIALYEKRYDDALKKSKEAYAKSMWSYEAKTLEGKALSVLHKKSLMLEIIKALFNSTNLLVKHMQKQPILEEAEQTFI